MKRHIPILIISLMTLGSWVSAQNVGIGTDTPDAKLEVADSGRVFLRVSSLNNKGAGLELFSTGAGVLTDWRIRTGSPGTLFFQRSESEFIGLNSSTTAAVFTQDGRFGFGTVSPDVTFELEDSDNLTKMRVTSTTLGSRPSYNLASGDVPDNSRHWRMGIFNSDLVFQTGRNNYALDSLEAMRIVTTGDVGIGTDHPNQHLEVAGPERQVIRVTSTIGSEFYDAALDLVRGTAAAGEDWRMINDNGYLRFMDGTDNFQTDGDENMRITPEGNVGINMPLPQAKLHVNGGDGVGFEKGGDYVRIGSLTRFMALDDDDIQAQAPEGTASNLAIQQYGGNLSLASQFSSQVGIGTLTPQAKLHISEGADVDMGSNGYLMLGVENGPNVTLDNNEIMARDNGDTSALYLQHDAGDLMLVGYEGGQVGIGIISPTSLPDDRSYLLNVDGKILCEEVHVELSEGWPDYVFEEEYNLRSLPQLADEIKSLGHLPGIPSAEVMDNDGVLVGDMQRLMMEKIEELTLYMIEADRQIRELQKQNAALSNQLSNLQPNVDHK